MQAQSARANEARARDAAPTRLPYLPGLDGLRALAVIAVLLYHTDLYVYGGYLGVESFFVLSGFLITALLLADWQERGGIDLKAFWARRARRLLPALFLTLAGTLVLSALLLPDEFADLTRDAFAAVGYVTNWYLIARQQSYFDAVERPPLLQHLWSLAIEEQFYILWPLVFAVGMRFLRATGVLALTLLAAIASVALMAVLYDPGANPSRIYYGTDTRASALLFGAALALVWAPRRAQVAARRKVGVLLDVVGMLGLVGLVSAYVLLHEQHPLLYRGGFGLVSIGTLVVIAATTHPAARLMPRLLEWRPLRWIGVRSYGIYLWHWPIFLIARPGVDGLYSGWQLQVFPFVLIFALAALSYTFVERPIRHGALVHVWRALRQARATGTPLVAALADGAQKTDQRMSVKAAILARAVRPFQRWLERSRQPEPRHEGRLMALCSGLRAFAQRQQTIYQRWASMIATGVLMLGVLCVAGSMALAAIASIGSNARTLALAQTIAIAAPATAATAEVVTSDPPAAPTAAMAPTAATEEMIDPMLAAELQRILDTTVADRTIPGAVLSVRLPNGATWTGASGLADRGADMAMEPETRVRVGSLSKLFTAVVVLQLAAEGTIDLDTPVATWLPDLLPNGDAITVRQLLQHTSGLYDYLEDRRFVSQAYAQPERVWEARELVAYATRFPVSSEPGARDGWNYSSTNYVILGMIVEQATGNSLGQELRQRIFEPLALHQTYFAPEDEVEGPSARGYSRNDDHTDISMSFGFAAANIVTTADDLRRFGSALFSGQLIEPESLDLMEQFVNGKGQYGMPELEYGLGLMRNRLPVGRGPDGQPLPEEASRVVGHIGGFGGFRAALWYAPESKILVALSVNQTSTDPNKLATKVFDAILTQQGF